MGLVDKTNDLDLCKILHMVDLYEINLTSKSKIWKYVSSKMISKGVTLL